MGDKQYLAASFRLRWNFLTVRSDDTYCLRCAGNHRFNHVIARHIQRVVHDDCRAAALGVHAGYDRCGSAGQHPRELIHGDDVIVPGELVSLRCGSAGHVVVEVAAHNQCPRVGEALLGIPSAAQPIGGH